MKTILLVLATLLALSSGFRPSARTSFLRTSTSASSLMMDYKVVLVRHGESTWNEEGKFTGWYDCPLSTKGAQEAKEAGKILGDEGYKFDVAFTSMLKRAIQTCWYSLEATDCMYIPIKNAWELNERHYGGLQGLDKKQTVAKHGIDQVNIWRRSYATPPPDCDEDSEHAPSNDPKYDGMPEARKIRAESLSTTLDRVLPYWDKEIVPTIKSGKKVLIAAHGNSLRALVKHLDGISEDTIAGLNIPTGVPLVYTLDEDMRPVKSPRSMGELSGEYLGDQDAIRARIEGVKKQTG